MGVKRQGGSALKTTRLTHMPLQRRKTSGNSCPLNGFQDVEKVVSHGRYVAFQMAEVAIPRQMSQEILRLIAELRPQPPPARA